MIHGRYSSVAYGVYVDASFFKRNVEKIKMCSGFIGRGEEDMSMGEKTLLYFASDVEAGMFCLEYPTFTYVDKETAKPFRTKLKGELPVFADWYSNDEWRKWHNSKQNELLDVVMLSDEDLDKIVSAFYDSFDKGKIDIDSIYEELSLTKMSVQSEKGSAHELVYDNEKDELHVDVFSQRNEYGKSERHMTYTIRNPRNYKFENVDCQFISMFLRDGAFDSDAEISASTFEIINWFVKNLPAHYSVSKTKVKKKETSPKKRKNQKSKPNEVIWRTEYNVNLNGISRGMLKHEIKCLCWGVRGHERHYKNGKVIFISPYRKGKERNNPNAYVRKTYKMEEGE